MPTESLRVCLGSLLVFRDWNFLRRCKSRKPRSVMRGRLSGVATFELLVLAGSHGATQVTWQGTRQIYNENLLSRLGSLGRFIESQMFSRNVLLLTNRHFLMEKNFLSENFLWAQLAGTAAKRSQQLCTQARQCLGQCPSASELLILLPHTRGAHHGWCFRLDPACSSSAVCQVAGAGLRTTMPSALLPPALVFRLKDWLHTKCSRSKHYSIFRVSQQLSLLKISPQSGPSAGWQFPGAGSSQGISITLPFLTPSRAVQGWWAHKPARELVVRRSWLPASGFAPCTRPLQQTHGCWEQRTRNRTCLNFQVFLPSSAVWCWLPIQAAKGRQCLTAEHSSDR